MEKSGAYNSFSGGPPHGAPSWTTESGGGMGHVGLSTSQLQGVSGTNLGCGGANTTSISTTPVGRLPEGEGIKNLVIIIVSLTFRSLLCGVGRVPFASGLGFKCRDL